jgi:bifunctional non-homologous end joining protein LigD
MAMPTEDHPISYNEFEGTIPAGNYGAGKVIIWDKGTWIPLEDPHKGYRDGKLKFELRGHKLHGRWTLVRMHGRAEREGRSAKDPWLLIKERDEFVRPNTEFSVVDEMPDSVKALEDHPPAIEPPSAPAAEPASPELDVPTDGPPPGARKAALPDTLAPQLATLVDELPRDPERWLFEIKFDGYRMLARVEGGKVQLVTRNGNDWTRKLQPLKAALESAGFPDGWYDGEIVLPGEKAGADFQALQGAFDSARAADIVYYLFDIPFCAGHDLREVPLEARRVILQRVVRHCPHPSIRFSDTFDARPEDVVRSACELGLEGVIAKRRDSAYVTRRSSDWIKLKCSLRQEFVIGGWTDPQGSRTGVGSLLLGVYEDGKLRYAGNVGTGFNEETLRDLRAKLDKLSSDASPFADQKGIPRKPHWVRPALVCEVSFGEWTRDHRVRHSVFHGLRSDKQPEGIVREEAKHVASVDKPAKGARPAKPKARASVEAPPAPAAKAPRTKAKEPALAEPRLPASLRVSNPERIVDAESGTRKIDLVRYYALVLPLMMPHLKDRPIAMVRAPEGIGGELFFQKHMDRYKMAGIEPLDPAIFPGYPPMVYVAKPEGLLSAAQMNVVEVHTWNGVRTGIDKPDRVTFDLDPGEGVTWAHVQEAAQLVHAFLEELGLPSFLKTSGGKGLHIVVPQKRQ